MFQSTYPEDKREAVFSKVYDTAYKGGKIKGDNRKIKSTSTPKKCRKIAERIAKKTCSTNIKFTKSYETTDDAIEQKSHKAHSPARRRTITKVGYLAKKNNGITKSNIVICP